MAWWQLLGGLAGTGMVAKPIYDATTGAYQYFRPSKSGAYKDLLTAPIGPDGNPIIDDDLQRRLEWSGADDAYENLPGGVTAYLQQAKLAGEEREAKSAQRIRDLNPMNRLNEELVLAQKNDLLEAARHRRATATSEQLHRQNLLDFNQQQAARQAGWRNEDLIRQHKRDLMALENQATEMSNNKMLALQQLQDSRDRAAWERRIYEDQLGYDEQQRQRDQRKFYALLGQSILSEGVRAFF